MIYVTYGKMSKEGLNGLIAKPENRAEALGKMVWHEADWSLA